LNGNQAEAIMHLEAHKVWLEKKEKDDPDSRELILRKKVTNSVLEHIGSKGNKFELTAERRSSWERGCAIGYESANKALEKRRRESD